MDLQALRNELDQELIAKHLEEQFQRYLPSLKLNHIDFQIEERTSLLARLPEGDSRRAEIEQEVADLSVQRAAVVAEYWQPAPSEVREVEPPTIAATTRGQAEPSDPPAPATIQPQEPKAHWKGTAAKKPVRRNPIYEEIDRMLTEISRAMPRNHEEVFQFLDSRRVPLPNRRPFKSFGGWLKGFEKDRHGASAWLSNAWARLRLEPFARGPKN